MTKQRRSEMPKIQLSDEQSKKLIIFLSRVQLQGAEAPEFLDLVRAVQTPVKEETIKKEEIK